MDTDLYKNKLNQKGLYLWCTPELAHGRRHSQLHKIGCTTKSFSRRYQNYGGDNHKSQWTANFMLPLEADPDKITEMESYVKKKIYEYSQKHSYEIQPRSKNWMGEYYDVNVVAVDQFKQRVWDLFQEVQLKLNKELINDLQAKLRQLSPAETVIPIKPIEKTTAAQPSDSLWKYAFGRWSG